MATETEPTPAVGPGPTIPVEKIPEKIRDMAAEINTYMREMPRLLAEGEEGHYALIQGDKLYSVWDTLHDASQAGYEKFGLDGEFVTQPIRRRDYERFLLLLKPTADEGT
jgi:hypothetical protein